MKLHSVHVVLAVVGTLTMGFVTRAVAADLSQPIAASPDGHFLQQPNGEPFFWLGDTAWELFHRLDRDEAEAYLKDRAAKGFNVIQVVATGKVDAVGLDAPNRYGEVPFLERNPARPNPRYFEFVDWVIERAARHGIRVALLPAWGLNFVSGGGEAQVFTAANAEIYGRWLAQRYRNKGIIWVLGGDVTPLWPATPANRQSPVVLIDYRPVYDAMAAGIVSGDGGNPFITYHVTVGSPLGAALPRTSLYFADRDWLDMNMIQSSHSQMGPGLEGGGDYRSDSKSLLHFLWNGTFNYLPITAEYRSSPVRPIIDAEPCYEDHPIWGEGFQAIGFWQAHHVRGALYKALFAGAAGHTYGNFSVWDFYDAARVGKQKEGSYDLLFAKFNRSSWQKALDAPGAQQMRHGKALMLSRPYFTRIPDQSVIIGKAGEGARHIAATRERTGSYFMIYLPQGQSVTVDLNKLTGATAVGWWFDPRTGKAVQIEGELPTHQHQRFTPPTSGPDQDWVLVIDDASKRFPPPGSATP